jgi:hypothetical protein
MVDIVSDAGGVRTIRRVSESFRLHLPSYSRHQSQHHERDQHDEEMVRVRLEVQEDRETGEIVYRLVDLRTGALIREWRGEHLDELRQFLQENQIQLLDKKI